MYIWSGAAGHLPLPGHGDGLLHTPPCGCGVVCLNAFVCDPLPPVVVEWASSCVYVTCGIAICSRLCMCYALGIAQHVDSSDAGKSRTTGTEPTTSQQPASNQPKCSQDQSIWDHTIGVGGSADGWQLTIPVPGTWYLVPGTWYLVPGTWYLVPGTWYQISDTWYLVFGSWHRV